VQGYDIIIYQHKTRIVSKMKKTEGNANGIYNADAEPDKDLWEKGRRQGYQYQYP
jgi:hypothetical protein